MIISSRLTHNILFLILLALAAASFSAVAGTPPTENGVTSIVLDEYNGYFAAPLSIF
jgi:hypothetical protein